MNCSQTQEWLNGQLLVQPDDELPAELAEHIKICPRCRREHEMAAQTLAAVRPTLKVDVSRHLKERIMSTVSGMNVADVRPAQIKPGRVRLWKSAVAMAVAMSLCLAWTAFYLYGLNPSDSQPVSAFSLLSKAWAAERAVFTADGVVHIVNEIVVTPISDPAWAQGRWFPLMAIDATGRPQFHQLALGAESGDGYSVDDQAWYDPATGRFARVVSAGGKALFANSYDGSAVYSLEVRPDGAPQVLAAPVGEGFRPPASPSEFLGIGAGLPSRLDELDESLVTAAGKVQLPDGSSARVVRSSMESAEDAPEVAEDSSFLFKIRESDNTIAEMEWVANGESILVIKRARTETLAKPQVSWDLAQLEPMVGAAHEASVSNAKPPAKPGWLSVLGGMVVSDITVEQMVDRAEFEPYIFRTAPAWAGDREITDVLDVTSPPKRMFAVCYRAEDGRHVVLFQKSALDEGGERMRKEGRMLYESPTGVKAWSGSRGKWLADILLKSSRAVIKDPPAEDRTGYIIETPEGYVFGMAVNGPISDDELRALVDSLVPAKEIEGE